MRNSKQHSWQKCYSFLSYISVGSSKFVCRVIVFYGCCLLSCTFMMPLSHKYTFRLHRRCQSSWLSISVAWEGLLFPLVKKCDPMLGPPPNVVWVIRSQMHPQCISHLFPLVLKLSICDLITQDELKSQVETESKSTVQSRWNKLNKLSKPQMYSKELRHISREVTVKTVLLICTVQVAPPPTKHKYVPKL